MASPHVHSMWTEHKGIVVFSSAGFALLYAELAWFAHAMWRARADSEVALIIALVFVLTLAAYLASFVPARAFTVEGVEEQGSLVLPELTAQMGKGAALIMLASVIVFVLCLYLIGFNLDASYTLLNNMYVFTLAGAGLLHILVMYVRYGALLYAVKQDSWIKVLVVSGGLAFIILASFVFLISLDVAWLNSIPAAQHGLV
ncbi:MAG: hypothetical protein LC737_03280, partial [Chloroflexi bacterium]|nr:hypothetical protein [Chloroflexota bacterium]